jgi:hypothetical protein
MTKWEARITYSAQEKEKNQRFKLEVLTFNEMLAEDANLLPDRLLSSLLCLSHRDEHLADIQGSTKLAATRRNASEHTRREEALYNSSEARESQRQYDLQDVHIAVKQKTCTTFSKMSLILWLLQIKYTRSKDDAQNRKLDYRENLE